MGKFFAKKNKNIADAEARDAARADLIETLKAENAALRTEISKYTERERRISDALGLAEEKAVEYREEARIRFELEMERLDNYRKKWTGYVNNLESAERLGEEIIETHKKLKECRLELERIIDSDFPTKTPEQIRYEEERERLGAEEADDVKLNDFEIKDLIEQLLKKDMV